MNSWHHSPAHLFMPHRMYMVTAGTYDKAHLFRDDERLSHLERTLLETIARFGWQVQAWAVFSNHYHFIALAPDDPSTLTSVVRQTHSLTAREVNGGAGQPGRKVWHQYWDTCLTHDRSYWARMSYVHRNAVHHNLVATPEDYPYCSARWMADECNRALRRKVESFGCDLVKIQDDF